MMKRRIAAALLVISLLLSALPGVLALEEDELQAMVEETAAFQLKSGTLLEGSEWSVLGLARSGCALPEGCFDRYYESVKDYLAKKDGDLRKVTEYARLSIALTAIGKDAAQVGDYDLTEALLDFDRMTSIGMNGAIWALLGLDCGSYRTDDPEAKAVREKYIDYLLGRQLADGGFSLVGRGGSDMPADTDITAMTLQALAGYPDLEEVQTAVDKALDCLSLLQQEDGGFGTMGAATSESAAQVVVALTELGIDPEDPRFVKNGRSVLDALLDYRQKDGSFLHSLDGEQRDSGISVDQGMYAMVAALLFRQGKGGLYHMSGTVSAGTEESAPLSGLPGKDPAVRPLPVTKPGITFPDVAGTVYEAAVEALASREIINGMGDGSYQPDATMTRAQYAAIVVRALGLEPEVTGVFPDVSETAWYAGYVGTAHKLGLVNGRDDGGFWPGDTITRQEAAALTSRAAKLCGMDTELDDTGIRFYIAQFSDYVKVSSYARGPYAFCFREGILREDEFEADLLPKEPILRGEIALMLYRLLQTAQLLGKD